MEANAQLLGPGLSYGGAYSIRSLLEVVAVRRLGYGDAGIAIGIAVGGTRTQLREGLSSAFPKA